MKFNRITEQYHLQIKKVFLSILFLSVSVCLSAQTKEYSKENILRKIETLQLKNDAEFADGLFISERFKDRKRNLKRDNNIFFPALITYTLGTIKNEFQLQDQTIIDSIRNGVIRNYPKYRNRKGEVSFNYWQTHPDMPMPGSKFWANSDKIKLPDDLDCTSIIYLSLPKNDTIDQRLKQLIIKHTNLYDQQINSIYKRYQNHKAYMTWFAQKLKQDFDICVMANTMLYIFNRNFDLNEYDRESIRLIEDMVQNDDHLKNPHIISPYYKTPFIILYHLARVVAADKNNEFSQIKSKIISDIKLALLHVNNKMEKVLLLSSLNRLGVPTNESVNLSGIEEDFKKFNYFVVNPFHGSSIGFKKLIGRSNFLQMNYRCEAYYWTLILEYIILSEKNRE